MAQKAVLDNKSLENITLSEYLPKTGGTISGDLTITGNLIANIDNSNSLRGFASTTVPTANANCNIIYNYNIYNNSTGCFPTTNNANGILTVGRHGGNYNTQLGFSSNGNLYYRSFDNQAIDTNTSWKTILDNNNFCTLLWTNTNYPSLGNPWTINTITLSQTRRNFMFLLIEYVCSRTDGQWWYSTRIIPTDRDRFVISELGGEGSVTYYVHGRECYFVSDTVINMYNASWTGYDSNTRNEWGNDNTFPTRVYGIIRK